MAKPTVKLWSVLEGKKVDFEVSIDGADIVAVRGDESIKFPGGITKEKLLELVEAHNKANDGIKAISQEELEAEKNLKEANEQLLKDLA